MVLAFFSNGTEGQVAVVVSVCDSEPGARNFLEVPSDERTVVLSRR